MTRYIMAWLDLDGLWLNLPANALCIGTSWVESTARRRVDGIRDLSFVNDPIVLDFWVWQGYNGY